MQEKILYLVKQILLLIKSPNWNSQENQIVESSQLFTVQF